MLEKWTGAMVGKMHIHKVTLEEMATEMGVGKAYVSMILNGARKPEGIKERMDAAFKAIIDRRKQEDMEL